MQEDVSKKFCEKLKLISADLYGNLDANRKSLLIRMTGDNFRASRKQYTEQVSFSILNIKDFLHSPYGQFTSTVYRGKKSTDSIGRHTTVYHNEVKELLLNGVDFVLPSGESEAFNVIPFMCADLSYLKEILGRCSCTSIYGCIYCKKLRSKWADKTPTKEEKITMKEMVIYGEKGEEVLGSNPDQSTSKFTTFQHSHYGQYGLPLFDGLELELLPPCGLHLILAHHRYLWEFLYSVLKRRKQEEIIPSAFKKIDCSYLALQYNSFLNAKSNSKFYDGMKN